MTITNKLIRNAIRIPSWILLIIYAVQRIAVPVIENKPVYLDKNDGYIIFGCLAILLSIEAVKAAVDKFVKTKSE